MKRRADLIIAFFIALALHGIAGVCADNLLALRHGRMAPIFKEGESSVAFTLLPSREAVTETPEETEVKKSPVLETPDWKDVSPEEICSQNDADTFEKGVETFSAGMTELRPRYPLGSRIRGEEGVVTVRVRVNALGRADKVDITEPSGYPALDRAAVDAVRRARFIMEGSAASGGEILLSFRFRLVD